MDHLNKPPESFGVATFRSKDNVMPDVKWDRIAYDGNTLCLISIVAEPMRVKAIRAILHQKREGSVQAGGLYAAFPSRFGDKYAGSSPGTLSVDEAGYHTHSHRLDYGLTHTVFVTKNDNFMRFLSPESLWSMLSSDRQSTPLLQEWMPYLAKKLIDKRYLRECRCHRANCGVLGIPSEAHLDELVSEGIKRGEILIP